MRDSRIIIALVLLVALGLTSVRASAQYSASFQGLGVVNPNDPFSQALAVSGDGKVVQPTPVSMRPGSSYLAVSFPH